MLPVALMVRATELSPEAVEAAARVLARDYGPPAADWRDFTDDATEIVVAAYPHLGIRRPLTQTVRTP